MDGARACFNMVARQRAVVSPPWFPSWVSLGFRAFGFVSPLGGGGRLNGLWVFGALLCCRTELAFLSPDPPPTITLATSTNFLNAIQGFIEKTSWSPWMVGGKPFWLREFQPIIGEEDTNVGRKGEGERNRRNPQTTWSALWVSRVR
jgi:hypothetical protein